MSAGKILTAVLGAVIALVAAGLIAGGAGLLWAYGTQRTADGYFTSSDVQLSTGGYALVSGEIDLGSRPSDWFPTGQLATIRLNVESTEGESVFLGIGPAHEVDAYLDDAAISEVTRIGPTGGEVAYREVEGDALPAQPSRQSFWAVSTEGPGSQTLTWEAEQGEWTVVIMNSEATPGLAVEASAAASTELLVQIGGGLFVVGLLFAAISALLLVVALRRPAEGAGAPADATTGGFGPYPVRLEADLDPGLSRWLWLVKWFLAIPHFIVLGVLWTALALLTLVAGFAILFTGRYPRSIFDFNVGVMRWTWRVAYYSYSGLGTDQYPPFTLANVAYPARLDVAYPERLSRGLVLIKWWLLAIPHYLIVGLLTNGLVWWTTEAGNQGDAVLQVGGGLIGILVLVAAIALAFTGRYPQGLFDLIVGLNRWVYRVFAYAALMRDEYPPFRLDTGGSEPPAPAPSAPERPTAGGSVATPAQLGT